MHSGTIFEITFEVLLYIKAINFFGINFIESRLRTNIFLFKEK